MRNIGPREMYFYALSPYMLTQSQTRITKLKGDIIKIPGKMTYMYMKIGKSEDTT